MPALPPNSLIVVTGITGYIASHVGLTALQAGHRVRATVRSLSRSEEVKTAYAKHGVDVSKLEFVVIDDLTSEAQLANAIKGVDGVAHVAIPGSVPGDSDENPQQAVDSNVNLLRAASREPSIKRIVLTSSSAASIAPPSFKDGIITDKDWNEKDSAHFLNGTAEDKKQPDWVMHRYAASKTLSEKAAWKWVEEEKPSFEVVTILPNVNFGPSVLGDNRSTLGWIYALSHGVRAPAEQVPPQWFVDVRDDARLHVEALTNPSLGGKRIWGVAAPFGWNQILAILRGKTSIANVPADVEGKQGEPDPQRIDNSVATEALGSWISLEQSVLDSVKSFGL